MHNASLSNVRRNVRQISIKFDKHQLHSSELPEDIDIRWNLPRCSIHRRMIRKYNFSACKKNMLVIRITKVLHGKRRQEIAAWSIAGPTRRAQRSPQPCRPTRNRPALPAGSGIHMSLSSLLRPNSITYLQTRDRKCHAVPFQETRQRDPIAVILGSTPFFSSPPSII